MTPRPLLTAALASGLLLAPSACALTDPAAVLDASTDASTTDASTTDTIVTTDTTGTVGTSSPATSAPAAPTHDADVVPSWATDGTVALALTVHVERHDTEVDDPAEFAAHVATLEELATLAEAYGVVLNFELSSPFVTAVDRWGSTFIGDMTSRGHTVSQHSGDRSIDGLGGEARVAELVRQREAIEAHGVDVTYVSGGCSADEGWVEDAIAAGFDAVTGTTEFCLGSLDDATLPDGMDWVHDCPNAAVCHDPLRIQLDRLLHPWTTSSTATWLADDPGGELVVVAGMEADGLAAMSMTGDADLATATAQWQELIDTAVAGAVSGRVNAVNVVLSVGPTPDWEVLEAMFDIAATSADLGDVTWVSLADVVAVATAEASTLRADADAAPTDTTPDLGGSASADRPGGSAPPFGRPVDGTLPD